MIYLYGLLFLMAVLMLGRVFARDFRLGVLCGLTVLVFVPLVIPIHLLPINGVVVSLQLGFVFLAFLALQIRDRGTVDPQLNQQRFAGWVILGLLFGFALLLFTFCFISPDAELGFAKTGLFVLRVLIPLLGFIWLLPITKQELRVMFNSILMGSVLVAVGLFAFGDIAAERVGADASPITMGRAIGLGAVLCITMFLTNLRTNSWVVWGYLALGLVLLFTILFTGSRGPLLAVGVALLAILLLAQSGAKSKLFSFLRLALLGAAIFAAQSFTPVDSLQFRSVNRVFSYLETLGTNSSDLARIRFVEVALNEIQRGNLIGVGTGGFTYLMGSLDYQYPHNVLLEVLVEQGLLGLLALLVLFVPTLSRLLSLAIRARGEPYTVYVVGLFVYSLTNALASGDIGRNQLLWLAMALVWLVHAGLKQAERDPNPKPSKLELA
ncbi:MAG: O-antigen ligase family protein [Meiothermus sp.]|nr:O-antigen ligase family protein [Meiothermus sp.]